MYCLKVETVVLDNYLYGTINSASFCVLQVPNRKAKKIPLTSAMLPKKSLASLFPRAMGKLRRQSFSAHLVFLLPAT